MKYTLLVATDPAKAPAERVKRGSSETVRSGYAHLR
jgi:hypothetical protein